MPDPSQLSTGIQDAKSVLNIWNEGASTTLASYHAGGYLRCGNMALTIPLNSTVPFLIGTIINGIATNASPNTFTATGGVTLNSKGGSTTVGHQWGGWSLVKVGINTWDLIGDLA